MGKNTSLNSNNSIWVKKASGDEEPFDITKLERSLLNAGANADIVVEIVSDIQGWIFPGVSTKKIYSRAFQLLRLKKTVAAVYYKLKQAIMEFGQSGYPFEDFIGKIFEKQGFNVQVGQILEGFCVSHEMDVIATNKNTQHLVECKYRTAQEKNISIQVPLYVRARIDDIIKKRKELPAFQGINFQGWVVTNTRFSPDSIEYARCSGLHLLGWDYPSGKGLKEIIEKEKLYPVTVLNQLTKKEKQVLLDKGIVLCSQLLDKSETLDLFQLSSARYNNVIKELQDICN